MRSLGDRALFLLARVEGQVVIGLMAARQGEESAHVYGASCLVQFEAMRWARDEGCARYDLWGGIPSDDELGDLDDYPSTLVYRHRRSPPR